ncbi:MAG: hypothetical protein U0905_11580 [Pirellulales bacterium]
MIFKTAAPSLPENDDLPPAANLNDATVEFPADLSNLGLPRGFKSIQVETPESGEHRASASRGGLRPPRLPGRVPQWRIELKD